LGLPFLCLLSFVFWQCKSAKESEAPPAKRNSRAAGTKAKRRDQAKIKKRIPESRKFSGLSKKKLCNFLYFFEKNT
jgi:hypothetical protein